MISVERLTKNYGPIEAVKGISFELNPGDVLGFLGPNGAGKSTTMKMVTGFLKPTSGRITVGGYDVARNPLAAKRLFGYLPERGPLYEEMSVMEFLEFMAKLRDVGSAQERAARVEEVISDTHLERVRSQTLDTLSKGYRQRVGMAQAIIHNPRYLIMDEPTDGLDPNQKDEVRKLIKRMSRDKAIILSTHILEEVEALCNRIIIIDQGTILINETPAKLRYRHRYFNALRLRFDGEVGTIARRLREQDFVEEAQPLKDALLVVPKNRQSIDTAVLNLAAQSGWKLLSVEKVPNRMEDVFREITIERSLEVGK